MQTSSLHKEVTHPNDRYSVKLVTTDNKKICLREDKTQFQFESCLYIWCKKSDKNNNLGWNVSIKGDVFHFGFTKKFSMKNIFRNRPFTHKKDLLSQTISEDCICYCILGLSEKEGRCLEALYIKEYFSEIINKRRERKYEKLIDNYLNTKTRWK